MVEARRDLWRSTGPPYDLLDLLNPRHASSLDTPKQPESLTARTAPSKHPKSPPVLLLMPFPEKKAVCL